MSNKLTFIAALIGLAVTITCFAGQPKNSTNARLAPEATATEAKLAFRDIPHLEKAFINVSPEKRQDLLTVGKLGTDGGNKTKVIKLAKQIAKGKHGAFDSLLIAHKGKLIFESYYLAGRINLPHFQASATKAYTSLILGRAMQLGYLTMDDLDKPLVHFLKDLEPKKWVKGAENITLHQALTMRSGIRLTKEQRQDHDKPAPQLRGQGQVQTLLTQTKPITLESQQFMYQGSDPNLVMQVIDAVVPGSAEDFIKTELLDKLGINNYQWKTNVSGLPEAGWGTSTSITSRDMLKLGLLTLNKGQWRGEQLIPAAYIDKATSRQVFTGDDDIYGGGKDVSNQGYGYFWWGVDLKHGNRHYTSASAQGGGSQMIMLIEELDLLIVMTAQSNDISCQQIAAEHILPAFVKS